MPGITCSESIVVPAARGAELSGRLLAYSSRQYLEPEVIDVGVLVRESMLLFKHNLGDKIKLTLEDTADGWYCLIDPGQLENALLNLVVNARDALKGVGRLRISTGRAIVGEDEPLSREGLGAGEYVALAIEDNGTGIPPGIISQVFEPFFTTKEFGQGSGLGLSMVYGFVK